MNAKIMNESKRILIVEDDSVLRDVLSQKLEKSGYIVLRAEDGVVAMEKIREFNPHMVLLDILMPRKSGMQVLEEIHADAELKKIPVIIISNSGQPIEITRARELGARDILVKAVFDPSEVLEKIERVLAVEGGKHYPSSQKKEYGTQEFIDHTLESGASQEQSKTEEGNAGGMFILVVEDDKFLRELLVRKLSKDGFDVQNAIDAAAAYAVLNDRIPKIILLDLILPGVDGFEILAHIKADPKTKDIPVIVLSNLGQKEDIEKAMALGAKDFMIKANFTLDEIIHKVRSIIG